MRVEQVFITPIIRENTYGVEIDVSEYVSVSGISKIKRAIDSTDYSIGVYRFSDLTLKCENALGTFNENDSRSIFPAAIDRAKVRISVLNIDSETFETTSKIQFEGIINDEATRHNITTDVVTFKVLSKDSIFRTTNVPAGIITNGSNSRDAIISILAQAEIQKLLTINQENIQPDYEFVIDIGPEFDNLGVKEALDLLLVPSSSVLVIRNDTVFVQPRENDTNNILDLRGRGELSNNANIISISSYNSGKQRQFNSVSLNDIVIVTDNQSIDEYGLRSAEFDFPMITDLETLQGIGGRILGEFRYPKIELKLRIPTEELGDFDLLDLVRVDAPWLRKHEEGDFMPVFGSTVYGDTKSPYPITLGSLQILRNLKFKIISIEDDPKSFITTLKIRQFGKFTNDGVFLISELSKYAEAIYGISVYAEELPADVYGTAIYGVSKYGG